MESQIDFITNYFGIEKIGNKEFIELMLQEIPEMEAEVFDRTDLSFIHLDIASFAQFTIHEIVNSNWLKVKQ